MINTAVIMGRLTGDAELRTTNSGTPVTSFTVAVDRRNRTDTDFINVVAWQGTAEFISKWFHKGDMIAVTGSIQTRNYEDKAGNKRTAVEIVAENASFCGGKSAKNETGPTQSGTPKDLNVVIDDDDDLPF